ncbi:MAG: hypothetical protein Q9184_007984 [Pyrenodesmia sp. 2 TL-2023]
MGLSLRENIVVISIFFSVLATTAVFLRLYARRVKGVRFGLDDYTILPALCEFAVQLLSVGALTFTKISITLFYRRIFRGKLFNILVWILCAVIVGWGIAFFFATLFECVPVSLVWKTFYGEPRSCYVYFPMFIATAVTNMVIDFALIGLPWPMIWRLQMPLKQKIAVGGVFTLGALVCAISIARLAFFMEAGRGYAREYDVTYNLAPTLYWTQLEAAFAVISACLPTLRPLFHGFSPESVFGSFRAKLAHPFSLSKKSVGEDNAERRPSQGSGYETSLSALTKDPYSASVDNRVESNKLGDLEAQGEQPAGGITVQKSIFSSSRAEFRFIVQQYIAKPCPTKDRPWFPAAMEHPSEDILLLSRLIDENTRKVADYLSSQKLPFPSFSVSGPMQSCVPAGAEDIELARQKIIDATQKLQDLMLGPRDYLQSFHHDELISMQAVSRFKMASSFPIKEETSFAHIANTCDLPEPIVRRLVRYAMTKHIFHEPRKGVVTHSAASRLLAEDHQMNDWVAASTDELWQAASQTLNALVKYNASQEPHETGFALANGTDKSIYQFFSEHPDRARRFGNAMVSYERGTGYDLRHLIDSFDWEAVGNGTVVDVGGSNGFVSLRLASTFPRLKCVVQDLPEVVEQGRANTPSELADRVQFMAHDFLTEQPVKGADVYLFRWIFHNWSDAYCIRILKNLIPALKSGAMVVINDNCLPEPGTLSLWQEERIRYVL